MKIDFEKFKVFTDLTKSKTTEINVKSDFANVIYQRGQGLAYHALAIKIYNSIGETEFTPQEYAIMKRISEALFSPQFIDALKEYERDPQEHELCHR